MQRNYPYLITFAYAFSTFTQGILTPLYAFFVQKIGGGILEASWAIGTYSVVTGLCTIILHRTASGHGYRERFLWGGWFLWLIGVAIYFVMYNVYLLYLSQLFNALGTAMAEPVFDAEFSEKVASDPAGGWAFFEGITNVFSGVASILGGIIASWYGFDTLINYMIGCATLSFFLIVYYMRCKKKNVLSITNKLSLSA